jgi:hypothetical protein
MEPIYSSITSHHTISKIDEVAVVNQFEPYLYYIFVFIGLMIVFGILVFFAYKATNKQNINES